MAAIGSVWESGTWQDDSWGLDTWGTAIAPPIVIIPPSPTQLSHSLVNTELLADAAPTKLTPILVNTTITVLDEDGDEMPIPLTFTQFETGPINLLLQGVDGTPEDLSTATSVTLRVADYAGTPIVNAVALTDLGADGTATWTRLAAQVATAGDYRYQVRVVRIDNSIAYYPDGQLGMPLTILPTV